LNILLISPFFYPEPISTGKYNTDLALNLAKRGHKVHVWCFHSFYPDWKVKKSDQQLKNIFIKRGGLGVRFTGNQFIDRIILELSFLFFVIKEKVKNKQGFDNIIFISPPSLSIIILKAFRANVNKVIIVHDLQFIHIKSINKTLSKVAFFIEKKLMCLSNKLIFLSEEMKSFFDNSKQFANSHIHVQWPFVNIEKSKSQKPILKKGINIVYSGALGAKQSPKRLLSLFEYVSTQNKDWNFYFFSSGSHFDSIKKSNNNPKIHFLPLVDEEKVYQLYTESTVQVIPQTSESSSGSLPSKLPNLIYSGTKILTITDSQSELEKIIQQYSNGISINSWENHTFAITLDQLVHMKSTSKGSEIESMCQDYFSVDSLIAKIVSDE
jgi:colanic acid biosynthesis glycosyl transferase WcaI